MQDLRKTKELQSLLFSATKSAEVMNIALYIEISRGI